MIPRLLPPRFVPALVLTVGLAVGLAETVAASPNLTVRIDDTVVESNSTVQFDGLAIGDTDQIVVALRNESAEDLVFTEVPPVVLGGGFPDQFELVQPALESGNKLSPNGSTAFAIRFTPTIPFAAPWTNVFVFTNASAAPFRLDVRGSVLFPTMEVQVDGQSFARGARMELPALDPGQSEQLLFVVRNVGDAPLRFTGDPIVAMTGADLEPFEVVQPALEAGAILSPNGSTAFAVRYAPAETPSTSLTVEIRIDTDDPDGAFVFELATAPVDAATSSWGGLKARY